MIVSVYISKRGRGIYLCHGTEDRDGTEDWEAVGTLAAAKRWGAAYIGTAWPTWVKMPDYPVWSAHHDDDDDGA